MTADLILFTVGFTAGALALLAVLMARVPKPRGRG